LIPVLLLFASSCGTSNSSRFYTLETSSSPVTAPAVPVSVLVGPVSVPAAVDRPQFVLQVSRNQVKLDEYHRWASPLADGIARALAGDLASQLGTPDVAVAPMANFQPAYRVAVDVQRFESIPGQATVFDAIWTIRETANGRIRSGRAFARESVQDNSFDALAAAHSRAIAKLSKAIAASIRSESSS
jgi:uncharacterized lipoprotein YmbA